MYPPHFRTRLFRTIRSRLVPKSLADDSQQLIFMNNQAANTKKHHILVLAALNPSQGSGFDEVPPQAVLNFRDDGRIPSRLQHREARQLETVSNAIGADSITPEGRSQKNQARSYFME